MEPMRPKKMKTTIDKKSVDKKPIDRNSNDKNSVDKKPIDKKPAGKKSFGKRPTASTVGRAFKPKAKLVEIPKVRCFECAHLDGRGKCQKQNKWLERWETKTERECNRFSQKPLSLMPKKKRRVYSAPKESREEVVKRVVAKKEALEQAEREAASAIELKRKDALAAKDARLAKSKKNAPTDAAKKKHGHSKARTPKKKR